MALEGVLFLGGKKKQRQDEAKNSLQCAPVDGASNANCLNTLLHDTRINDNTNTLELLASIPPSPPRYQLMQRLRVHIWMDVRVCASP